MIRVSTPRRRQAKGGGDAAEGLVQCLGRLVEHPAQDRAVERELQLVAPDAPGGDVGDLARDLAETFRRLMQSDLYKELFPATRIDPRHHRFDTMRTTAGGSRMALSLAGPMTGKMADLIMLDDLIKADDIQYPNARADLRNKFDQSIYSRLDSKRTGAIVSVAQRLHADDITAYLLEKGGFRHLCLSSIAEDSVE